MDFTEAASNIMNKITEYEADFLIGKRYRLYESFKIKSYDGTITNESYDIYILSVHEFEDGKYYKIERKQHLRSIRKDHTEIVYMKKEDLLEKINRNSLLIRSIDPSKRTMVTRMGVPEHGRPYVTKMGVPEHGRPFQTEDVVPFDGSYSRF